MPEPSFKERAHRLVDGLPDDATWEDLEYAVYVHRSIEAGLKDSREGRPVPHEEAVRQFELRRRPRRV